MGKKKDEELTEQEKRDRNPLNLPDQEPPPETDTEGEPIMTEWNQPYSPQGEAPTSTPKRPPQPPADNTPVEEQDEDDE